MKIQITIITDFGTFKSETMNVTKEEYENVCEFSKNYYQSGFEMICDDGGFLIIPPDIVRSTILKINVL